MFKRLVRENKGATVIEYGLILGLVVLAMMVALTNFAASSTNMWTNISTKVQNAG